MQTKDPKLYDRASTKKQIKKYLIIMLCLVPIIIALNFTVLNDLASGWRITIDVLVILGLIFLVDSIMKARENKKNENKTKENK